MPPAMTHYLRFGPIRQDTVLRGMRQSKPLCEEGDKCGVLQRRGLLERETRLRKRYRVRDCLEDVHIGSFEGQMDHRSLSQTHLMERP